MTRHPDSLIANALFTKTQQQVLSLLYGKPEQSYYLNEIVRLAGVGKGSIARELEKFCNAGLLHKTRRGNQNYYQANAKNPIFSELVGITQKTFGLVNVLTDTLTPLLLHIDAAFLYGSVAKGSAHAGSDIDLLLISDELSYSRVMGVLAPAEQKLGRVIHPTLLSQKEFSDRIQKNQSFLTRVMAQPKFWLKGGTKDEHPHECPR